MGHVLLRCGTDRFVADLLEAPAQVVGFQRGLCHRAELSEDGFRQIGRRDDFKVGRCVHHRQTGLRHAGHVGQLRDPSRRASQRAQFAVANMLENGRDRTESEIDLPAEQVDNGWPAAAIRHRDNVDAGFLPELFTAEMNRRAEAGGRHAQRARLRLGQCDQLFDVADRKEIPKQPAARRCGPAGIPA